MVQPIRTWLFLFWFVIGWLDFSNYKQLENVISQTPGSLWHVDDETDGGQSGDGSDDNGF